MKIAKIEDHLSDKDMNDLLKEHKDSYNIYRSYTYGKKQKTKKPFI